ncbi:MAG TPA: thiamine phosphate synthase [Candidatus Hydrogenedentes bacterium]|nr:thiamine phosphate synthase [Candidatus Hydrogenedentota bacterium]
MSHAERMAKFANADLYVVITESFCDGRSALAVLDAVLAAGVSLVQFREKNLEAGELYRRALAFRERTSSAGALLIVDDRLDIALAVGADGVHLGQSDLPINVARRMAPELVIGSSTHDLAEAMASQNAGASYVNIGPIFATQTKSVPTGVVGPQMIDAIRPHLRIPFTTMGGIKLDNIAEVLSRETRHVAVVTAVTAAPDITTAARELREAILLHR